MDHLPEPSFHLIPYLEDVTMPFAAVQAIGFVELATIDPKDALGDKLTTVHLRPDEIESVQPSSRQELGKEDKWLTIHTTLIRTRSGKELEVEHSTDELFEKINKVIMMMAS